MTNASMRNAALISTCTKYAAANPRLSARQVVNHVITNCPAPYFVDLDHAVNTCNRLHLKYANTLPGSIPRPTLRQSMWVEIYVRARALLIARRARSLSRAVARVICGNASRSFISLPTALRIVAPHLSSNL